MKGMVQRIPHGSSRLDELMCVCILLPLTKIGNKVCPLINGGYAHGQSEWEIECQSSVTVSWQIDFNVIECSLI